MVDLAKLISSRSVTTSILSTPLNLSRFRSSILRHNVSTSSSSINILLLHFPTTTENLDSLPSRFQSNTFTQSTTLLQPQADDLIRLHQPDAIISDINLPWTAQISRKYNIPRITFSATSFFSLCVTDSITKFKPYEFVTHDFEPFLVPGLPHTVGISRSQMPGRFFRDMGLQQFFAQIIEAERDSYGVVANTFCAIEREYVEHYRKTSGKKVWPIGPVSLCNDKVLDMVERGNKASIDMDQCLTWLDSKEPNSVIYVCFGGLCVFPESQLVEIGLGLEASDCNFIWVIREGFRVGLAIDDLEERVKGRGIIMKGWAPQILILNHPAVGGFLTHCGWNSVIEAVSFGVPVITWPLFAEQFYNERFVVAHLRIGFGIGVVDTGLEWGSEEESGVLVKRNRVKAAVQRLMGVGESVREMREQVSRLSELARSAVSEGGSSNVSLDLLIVDLLAQRKERLAKGEEIN
ncbi:scopoletin glucosyltransferase-like [Camellia sinensis]|nr:scopoletin glucosyltransferase-like [Camellia sinensis]